MIVFYRKIIEAKHWPLVVQVDSPCNKIVVCHHLRVPYRLCIQIVRPLSVLPVLSARLSAYIRYQLHVLDGFGAGRPGYRPFRRSAPDLVVV